MSKPNRRTCDEFHSVCAADTGVGALCRSLGMPKLVRLRYLLKMCTLANAEGEAVQPWSIALALCSSSGVSYGHIFNLMMIPESAIFPAVMPNQYAGQRDTSPVRHGGQ